VYLLIKIKYIYIVNFSNYFSDLVSILLKPKTKNQKPKTKNQKPKTKNQKPKTKNHFPKENSKGVGNRIFSNPRKNQNQRNEIKSFLNCSTGITQVLLTLSIKLYPNIKYSFVTGRSKSNTQVSKVIPKEYSTFWFSNVKNLE